MILLSAILVVGISFVPKIYSAAGTGTGPGQSEAPATTSSWRSADKAPGSPTCVFNPPYTFYDCPPLDESSEDQIKSGGIGADSALIGYSNYTLIDGSGRASIKSGSLDTDQSVSLLVNEGTIRMSKYKSNPKTQLCADPLGFVFKCKSDSNGKSE